MRTKVEVDNALKEAEEKVKQLQAEKEALKALTPEEELAEALHKKRCTWNHTDGCGWFYEEGYTKKNYALDTHDTTHKRYLAKANLMLSILDDKETLLELIEVF